MTKCDAKARKVLYVKENATQKGTTENDSSRNRKRSAKDPTPQNTAPSPAVVKDKKLKTD